MDQLGNLDLAIEEAAKLADLKEYGVTRAPEAEPWFQRIMKDGGDDYMDSHLRNYLGEYYTTFNLIRNIGQRNPIQARLPFEPNIK